MTIGKCMVTIGPLQSDSESKTTTQQPEILVGAFNKRQVAITTMTINV
jgi:hypothetical protein